MLDNSIIIAYLLLACNQMILLVDKNDTKQDEKIQDLLNTV